MNLKTPRRRLLVVAMIVSVVALSLLAFFSLRTDPVASQGPCIIAQPMSVETDNGQGRQVITAVNERVFSQTVSCQTATELLHAISAQQPFVETGHFAVESNWQTWQCSPAFGEIVTNDIDLACQYKEDYLEFHGTAVPPIP